NALPIYFHPKTAKKDYMRLPKNANLTMLEGNGGIQMSHKEIVLIDGARTPFVNISGSFRNTTAIELGAVAAKEAIKKSGIRAEAIDHVIFGSVQQSSKDGHVLARHVGIKVGTPISVTAVTDNRLC